MRDTHMLTSECLPRETLKQYLTGWADPEQSEEIEAHVLRCPSCEQTIVALEQDPDTLCDFVRSGVASDLGEGSSSLSASNQVLEYAFAKAKQLPETDNGLSWQPATSQVGPYELIRPLGHGGMGSVYLARHRQLGKEVAIKLLPERPFRNDHYAARFQREIRAAGQLNHAAIVSASDAGQDESTHYLVMEYIEGLDLSRTARVVGALSVADACEITRIVALGLSHAHAEGIVHRDVKPSNVMLGKNGEVKILDFGLAQVSLWDGVSAELTTVGQLMGTLDYMSPEQAERADSVDYRADLYSLGATLFRLLCGRAPLAASPDLSPLAKLRLLGTHEPPRLDTLRPDAPPELVQLMNRLLARDPAQRPASAAHVAESLAPLASGSDLKALVAKAQAHTPTEEHPSLVSRAKPEYAAQARGSESRGGTWIRWVLLAALLPLLAWAGVLIVLETQKGQLVIESVDANIEVKLLRDGEIYDNLKIVPGANTTRLYAGTYEVVLASPSDGFEIDQGVIEIQQGKTRVARIKPSTRALAGAQPAGGMRSIPPASNAKLEPGDALEIRCLHGTGVLATQNVTVLADHTIKAMLVGVVDVKDMDLQELERHLNERYAAYMKDPGIEVFRDLQTANQFSNHLLASNDATESPSVSSKPAELMYDGRPLSSWLDQLSRERSPAAMMDAVVAIKKLVNTDNAAQISKSLLQTLRSTPEMVIRNNEFSSTLDFEIFGILAECTPTVQAYFEVMVAELKTADEDLSRRILANQRLIWPSDSGEDPRACLTLVKWIEENVLESNERDGLIEDAALVLANLLNYLNLDESIQSRLMQDLVDCDKLGPSFWLVAPPGAENGGQGYQQWNARFASEVESRTCRVLSNPDSAPQFIAQAAMLLSILGSEHYDRSDLPPPSVSADWIAAQLNRMLESPSDVLRFIEVDPRFGREALPTNLEAGPVKVMTINGLSYKGICKASPAAELIKLVSLYDLPRDQLREELAAVIERCKPDALSFAEKLQPNPYFSHSLNASLVWPEMQFINRASYSQPSSRLDLVKPVEWVAHFVLASAYQALAPADQQEIQRDMLSERKRRYAASQLDTADANSDGQLDDEELSTLNLPTDVSSADSDGNGAISLDELVPLFEPKSPLESWASRQIAKYDRNGDAVLDESEWNRMVIKPTGADENGDGIITVEEYSRFRERK